MKTKVLLAGLIVLGSTLVMSCLPAQSQDPASPVHELPSYKDIPECKDLGKDSGEEYCKGGKESFQGTWFVGSDK